MEDSDEARREDDLKKGGCGVLPHSQSHNAASATLSAEMTGGGAGGAALS